MSCSQLCDKLYMDRNIVTKKVIKQRQCPDCGREIYQYNTYSNSYRKHFQCKRCKHIFRMYSTMEKISHREQGEQSQRLI